MAGMADETLALSRSIVASETGQVPTEFWSSLDSSVGYFPLLARRRRLSSSMPSEKGGFTGNAAC